LFGVDDPYPSAVALHLFHDVVIQSRCHIGVS
jgi:hypothetical protein